VNASRRTVLLVEDDAEIRRFVRATLAAEGHRVVEAGTGHRGLIDAASHKPDLAVVDLGLPDTDGTSVIRRIREWSSMPIIVLSARSHERSKIEALDAGADDYVTKPFAVGEFLARVRAALRHAARPAEGGMVLKIGETRIDVAARHAERAGERIHLTATELRLLACLARHLGMVVTHARLLEEVWGPGHRADTHYLRVYMKQLRDKLEPDPVEPRHILTETGVGYRLLGESLSAATAPAASPAPSAGDPAPR
jgi:DNA-binding response OmpR family regulator